MSKLGLVLLLLLLAHIMALQVMANDESEAPLPGAYPLDHKPQKGVQIHDQKKADNSEDHLVSGATESSSSEEEQGESKEAEAPISHIRRLGKHHSTDESVAARQQKEGAVEIAFLFKLLNRKPEGTCIPDKKGKGLSYLDLPFSAEIRVQHSLWPSATYLAY